MNAVIFLDLPDRVTIEPMNDQDIEQVFAIEQASFSSPWKPDGFRTEMDRAPSVCLVVREGPTIYGYAVFWLIPPEIHLLNIAVHPGMRGRGLGTLLLDYLKEYGREVGAEHVYLEVRPSNESARKLYRQAGFVHAGLRKNYYAAEKEDALLLTLDLSIPG
jgi:[ribosomal protein S18]-alanine N-acetyltransferase